MILKALKNIVIYRECFKQEEKKMSGLNAFFKKNKKERATVKYAASKDFVDEEGKVMEWEIRPLKSKEADRIREECTSIEAKGKKVAVDNGKFNRMVAAACTIYPDLKNAQLQERYGVLGADNLIQELLDNDGEYQQYCKKVLEISGYEVNDGELVEEAKN